MARSVSDDGEMVSVVSVAAPFAPASEAGVSQQLFPIAPGDYDLGIYRGDSYDWIFQFLAWDGAPVDVYAWKFKAEIRSGVNGRLQASLQRMLVVDPTLNVEMDPEAVREEMRSGFIRMRLTANQSRLVDGPGVWDLEATTPDGWVKTVLRGAVEYLGDVTTGLVSPDIDGGFA